jgi:phosphoglycerate dehydrogenase-like enzyme
MRTIGVRKQVAPTEYFDEVVALSALNTYLPRCDWLVLACPLNAETRRLLDSRRIALLPHSAGVVNIARGELIDEPALIHALQNGSLGWAFLDVFAVEPLAQDSPLWALPNVLVSPHNAGASSGTYARGVGIFLDNLQYYVHSEPLQNEAYQ